MKNKETQDIERDKWLLDSRVRLNDELKFDLMKSNKNIYPVQKVFLHREYPTKKETKTKQNQS